MGEIVIPMKFECVPSIEAAAWSTKLPIVSEIVQNSGFGLLTILLITKLVDGTIAENNNLNWL